MARTEYQLDGATDVDRLHRAGRGHRRRRRTRCGSARPTRPATWRRPSPSRSRSTPRRRSPRRRSRRPTDDGWHAGHRPGDAHRDRRRCPASPSWSGRWTAGRGRRTPQPVDVTGDGAARAALPGHRRGRQRGDAQVGGAARSTATKPTVHRLRARRRPALRRQPGRPGHVPGGRPDLRHRDRRSARWTARPYASSTLQAMYELTLGLHELTVTATDKAGNETTSTVRFFVTTSFRDMQNLLDRFKATGRLSDQGAQAAVATSSTAARQAEANGNDARAISQLTAFRDARRRRRPGARRRGPGRAGPRRRRDDRAARRHGQQGRGQGERRRLGQGHRPARRRCHPAAPVARSDPTRPLPGARRRGGASLIGREEMSVTGTRRCGRRVRRTGPGPVRRRPGGGQAGPAAGARRKTQARGGRRRRHGRHRAGPPRRWAPAGARGAVGPHRHRPGRAAGRAGAARTAARGAGLLQQRPGALHRHVEGVGELPRSTSEQGHRHGAGEGGAVTAGARAGRGDQAGGRSGGAGTGWWPFAAAGLVLVAAAMGVAMLFGRRRTD